MSEQLTFFQPVGVRRGAAAIDEAFAKKVLEVPTREIRGMVRGQDGLTSQRAAVAVAGSLSELHRSIMQTYASDGPLTAKELEQFPQYRRYAPSTVRKRVSELADPAHRINLGRPAPHLVASRDPVAGVELERDGCTVYDIPGRLRNPEST